MRPSQPPGTVHPFARYDVARLIEDRARQYGETPFLIWQPFDRQPQTCSYRQFNEASRRVAAWLKQNGIAPGDHVLVHTDNCLEFLFTLGGCACIGAVAVTTNTRSTAQELAFFASATAPKIAVIADRYTHLLTADSAPTLRQVVVVSDDAGVQTAFSEILETPPLQDLLPPDPTRRLVVQFTSGTTSQPKGVVLTHGNLLWGGRLSAFHEQLQPGDRHLITMPLFHVNALTYSFLATLWTGASAVVTPRFSASRFWDISCAHNCTWASQSGFSYKALMNHPVPKDHAYRTWGVGVCDIPYDNRFGIRSLGWWGMTETIAQPIVGLLGHPNRSMSLGRPSPAYEIRIIGDAGTPVDFEQEGHLRVRGIPGLSLFLEYLDNPEATEAAFDDEGYLVTGDIVKLHDDGYISFVDRAKDMLKVGGENVAASEIEQVIAGVPGVKDVAVVGKPHPMLDEVPVAFVVKDRSGADEGTVSEKIDNACREALADFKRPRQIRFLETMPTATLGKIRKTRLKDLL